MTDTEYQNDGDQHNKLNRPKLEKGFHWKTPARQATHRYQTHPIAKAVTPQYAQNLPWLRQAASRSLSE